MADTGITERAETSVEEMEETREKGEAKRKLPEILPGADWNPVEDAFLKRRSVRKYKKKQVPAHLIRRILEVARYAPSQGNCQPWKFIVVRDQSIIDGMEDYGMQMMKMMGGGDPAAAENIHPIPRGLLGAPPSETGEFKLFHGAPTLIFPLMDSRGIGHPEIDLGIVGTNLIMAAHSLGLGTCWIGFAEFLNTGDWPKKLGVEEPYKLIEAITIGYPAGEPTRNHIQRETHAIEWFEDGKHETLY